MVALLTFVNLAGGLCFFLLGMHLLSKGLEKYAGARMQALIERMTNRPYKGFLVGIFTTASLQSSSLTMVTIIGLINAGLMTMKQAIGVILGAEIGTTLTVQIIAFSIGDLYVLPIIIGFLLYFIPKRFKYKYIGQAVIGFGLLFMGMSFMSSSMVPLAEEQFFVDLLAYLSVNVFVAILLGLVLTAIIQSSAAMIGTVIAMSTIGIISLPAAVGVVFGANIGTCVTSVIASWRSTVSAKRAALAQILTSVIGVVIFSPFIYQFSSFVQLTSLSMQRQIANAHTIFNLIVSLSLLPLAGLIVKMTEKVIPGKEEAIMDIRDLRKEQILKSPKLALRYAEKELDKVLKMTISMLKGAQKALLKSDSNAIREVLNIEHKVDKLRYVIEDFLDSVSWIDASERQLKERMRIAHNTTDMERVGDMAENIAIYARDRKKHNIPFSGPAMNELRDMFRKVIESYESATHAVMKTNQVLATKAIMLEEQVDKLYWKYRRNHIKRLQQGLCDPRAEEIFTNVMRDLERISDHADNLAKSIIHQEGFTELS